jgi:hypothetical protein
MPSLKYHWKVLSSRTMFYYARHAQKKAKKSPRALFEGGGCLATRAGYYFHFMVAFPGLGSPSGLMSFCSPWSLLVSSSKPPTCPSELDLPISRP